MINIHISPSGMDGTGDLATVGVIIIALATVIGFWLNSRTVLSIIREQLAFRRHILLLNEHTKLQRTIAIQQSDLAGFSPSTAANDTLIRQQADSVPTLPAEGIAPAA